MLHPLTKTAAGRLRAGKRRSCLLLGGLGLLALAAALPVPVRANPPTGTPWVKTFDDEFNATTPGAVAGNIWIPQAIYYNNGDVNNPQPSPNYLPGNYSTELAFYYPYNVNESGSGVLNLTAKADNNPGPFSSAFMVSRFQQAYGYYEVRMKPAISGGLDSTFWLVHNNSYPEIDIAEFPSGGHIYDGGQGPFTGGKIVNQAVLADGTSTLYPTTGTTFVTNFHTYAVDWEPTYMNFYVDGKISFPLPSGTPIPSDPMNVLLSIQMQRDTDQTKNGQPDGNPDGAWFGSPFDTAAANPGQTPGIYPATMQVDYVRVWQQSALLPYTHARPIAASGTSTVQAEDYILGGEGTAYHDSDPTNNGGQYRPLDGVDIENTYDTGGGYDIGWTGAGEYLKYTVNVAAAGTYAVSFRVADPNGPAVGQPSGDSFHLLNSANVSLTGPVSVPDTGGYQNWADTTPVNVTLKKGVQTLEMYEDTGGYNFNYFTFTAQ